MPNSDAAPQVRGARVLLSRSHQTALRHATTLARQRGDAVVSPLHVIAVLLSGTAGDGAGTPPAGTSVRPPRIGSALAAATRRAAAAAEASGAGEVTTEQFLQALASAAAASDEPVGAGEESRGGRDTLRGATWPGGAAAVDRVLRTLARRDPGIVVLVADPQVVPTRIAAGVARRLSTGAVPRALAGSGFATLATEPPLPSLGHRIRAALERLPPHPAPVVFVPQITRIAAATGGVDALVSAAARGLRLLAVGDAEQLSELAGDPLLRPLLGSVPVDAPPPEETVAILLAESDSIGRHHRVQVAATSAQAAVSLSVRQGHGDVLPGAALDLLEEACAAVSSAGGHVVQPHDVARAAVGDAEGRALLAGTAADLAGLEDRLRERVVGQDRAVQAVAKAIRRAETGVGDPDRPLGSFLFLGPTGVGKTELARTLVATLFGDESALIRLDMGEYQEAHSVARLVGAPPGYVGYIQGGHLAAPLRQRPFSVVLLDEIEKAHADVLNTLLAVLDEGRLTDGAGRTVDARHAVIIMTSNLASRMILDPELDERAVEQRVRSAVVEHFPPEFHSRIDDVVVFRRLTQPDLEAIAGLHLARLQARLARRHLDVAVSADVAPWLARQVGRAEHGARPLRALLRRSVEDILAGAAVDGRLSPDSGVALRIHEDGVVLTDG